MWYRNKIQDVLYLITMWFNLVPEKTNIDFVGKRHFMFIFAILLTIVSVVALYVRGLNYGIDFTGGILFEVKIMDDSTISDLRNDLSKNIESEFSLQEFGSSKDVLIKVPIHKNQEEGVEKIKSLFGDKVEIRRTETIGPKIGTELIQNAIYAVVLSLLSILIYVWFRFEWQFAICVVLTLIHDCIALLGMFAIFHNIEFSTNAIVSILITATYSSHDTIVACDRIRDHIKKDDRPFAEIINISINETLSRNIYTSATVLVALLCLFFFGGKVIADFSMPLIIGISFGAFSSVVVAVPLIMYTGFEKVLQKRKGIIN